MDTAPSALVRSHDVQGGPVNLLSMILKRLAGIVFVVITATFLLSLLMRLLPGDPAALIAAAAGGGPGSAAVARELPG